MADRGGVGDTWQHLILAHVLATHGRDEALRSARAAAGAAGARRAAELLLFLALSRESARTPITGLRVADVLLTPPLWCPLPMFLLSLALTLSRSGAGLSPDTPALSRGPRPLRTQGAPRAPLAALPRARPAPPEALAVRGSLRRLPALLTLPLSRFLPTSYGTPYRCSYCILALTPSP